MNEILASFISVDRFGNPYQFRLADELGKLDVAVDLTDSFSHIARSMKAADCDRIVHVHWLPKGYTTVRGILNKVKFAWWLLRLRAKGAALVWTAHNLYDHEAKHRRREKALTRFVTRLADGIIVHSPIAEKLLREEFRIPDDQAFAMIPHGNFIGCYPDTIQPAEARRLLGLESGERVALFLGNVRPYKGVLNLVETFRSLKLPGVRLVIAGRPLDDATQRAVESAIGGDPRILFKPGFVPNDQLQVYFRACDLVVLPYREVLTSGAAVLAMSFGKACVAAEVGSIPFVLSEQRELLYSPEDSDGLRAALERGLKDPQLTRVLGDRNLNRAKTWGWDYVARETARFYRQCLARRKGLAAQVRSSGMGSLGSGRGPAEEEPLEGIAAQSGRRLSE